MNAAKSGNPEAMFVLAEQYLSEGKRGGHTADASYYMEQAANLEYPRAALALAQMYQYGWAVRKDQKKSIIWYETAKKLGSPEADQYLSALKKQIRIKRLITALALFCFAGAAMLLPMLLNLMPNGVRVGPDTELVLPESALELARELNELIAEYDTERCETMAWMFFDCKELSELKADRELFHSDNLQSVSGMFKSSSISISDIDQIGWPKEDVEREDFMKGSGWKSKFKPVDG